MPSFSTTLEHAIHAALALANDRKHEFATLEHLLMSLLDEPDAEQVLRACSVDLTDLRKTLAEFIDHDYHLLVDKYHKFSLFVNQNPLNSRNYLLRSPPLTGYNLKKIPTLLPFCFCHWR